MCVVTFCGICGWIIPGFTQNHQKSAAEPRYMTFEAQNPEPFTIRDYALLRLEHVDAPQLVAAIVTC